MHACKADNRDGHAGPREYGPPPNIKGKQQRAVKVLWPDGYEWECPDITVEELAAQRSRKPKAVDAFWTGYHEETQSELQVKEHCMMLN